MRRPLSLIAAIAADRAARRIAFSESAPLVVLSPHFDDAVLSCWSILDSDRSAAVVDVFAGIPEPGRLSFWDHLTRATDGHRRAMERREEDRAALALAGREALALELLENGYRRNSRMLASRTLEALGAVQPRAACVVAPLGIGGHADHRVVRDAALALARNGMPIAWYCDIPYAARYGWPAWVTGASPEPTLDPDVHWQPWLESLPQSHARPIVAALTREAIERKRDALACYATQVPALDGGHAGVLTNPLTLGYEVFWTTSEIAELLPGEPRSL